MAKPAKASNTRLYLRVLRYLAPDGRHLILAVVLGLLTSLFSVVSIYTILPLLDAVFSTNKAGASVATMPEQITATASISPTALSALDSQRLKEQVLAYLKALLYSDTQENTLRNICLFLVITFLLKNFFLYLNNRLMVYVETKSANKLRNHVFEKILSLGLDYFHRHRVGMLMQRVGSDIYLIQTQVSGSLMNLLRNGILAVCYLAVLIIVSWKLTLFAFGVSLLSLAAIRFISQVIRRQADVIQDRSGEMNARAQEVFSGIKLVKAMVTEAFEAKRFATLTDLYR
ncbi:MAG: ABC transporter transmembrane domain-containing protein [Chloroherpetonaceae bacterium]|nr:ABC transporter transmembrane domain-containing protein [Chloroherpetonaceae bacterium]